MRDQEIRTAPDRHWAASDVNYFDTEHSIYHEDAVLASRGCNWSSMVGSSSETVG